jgi:hypothetical protein
VRASATSPGPRPHRHRSPRRRRPRARQTVRQDDSGSLGGTPALRRGRVPWRRRCGRPDRGRRRAAPEGTVVRSPGAPVAYNAELAAPSDVHWGAQRSLRGGENDMTFHTGPKGPRLIERYSPRSSCRAGSPASHRRPPCRRERQLPRQRSPPRARVRPSGPRARSPRPPPAPRPLRRRARRRLQLRAPLPARPPRRSHRRVPRRPRAGAPSLLTPPTLRSPPRTRYRPGRSRS